MDIKAVEQFESAYEKFSDSIYRYLFFKIRNKEQAVDLTQETFVKTWMYLAEGKEIQNIRAFLFRVAHNVLVNTVRSAHRLVSLEASMESGWEPGTDEDITKEAITKEECKEVVDKLFEIDEKYRDVLVLRYTEGLSVQEIAEVLGERENTVSVRIHRGIQQLRKLYVSEGKK